MKIIICSSCFGIYGCERLLEHGGFIQRYCDFCPEIYKADTCLPVKLAKKSLATETKGRCKFCEDEDNRNYD